MEYPTNGKKNINLKASDECENTTREVRTVNIIQVLEEGQYVVITEDGQTATISVDISSDYFNKHQINELIGNLGTVQFKIVSALPTVGSANIIYLVEKTAPDVGYNQFIWDAEDQLFYPIGDTDIDLSDYYTKVQADDKFQEKLTAGADIAVVGDGTALSQVTLTDKSVKQVLAATLWSYIQSKMSGAISLGITNDFTGNRALVSTPGGKISYSTITHEELLKLEGVTSNIQDQLDAKQDELTAAAEITTVADATTVSQANLTAKTVAPVKASSIWTYIKSKFITDTISTVTDTTKLGSVDNSKTNVVQETSAKDVFDYMWKKIYPVGAIYITTNSENPGTTFGGTWSKVDDGYFLRASSSGANSTLDEELPNVKGGNIPMELSNGSGSWVGALRLTKRDAGRSPNWSGDNGWGYLSLDASKMTNSVYKDNGKVQPKAYKVYVWRRTA